MSRPASLEVRGTSNTSSSSAVTEDTFGGRYHRDEATQFEQSGWRTKNKTPIGRRPAPKTERCCAPSVASKETSKRCRIALDTSDFVRHVPIFQYSTYSRCLFVFPFWRAPEARHPLAQRASAGCRDTQDAEHRRCGTQPSANQFLFKNAHKNKPKTQVQKPNLGHPPPAFPPECHSDIFSL
jgi:hypothetical protein